MGDVVFLNGEYVPRAGAAIDIEDRGFLFADALYEMARVYNGKPFCIGDHVRRMERGARAIKLDYGLSGSDLVAVIDELIERNGMPEASVYIQISRGVAPRLHPFPSSCTPTILVWTKPVEAMSMQERLRGDVCITHPDLRHAYCSVKVVSLLPNVMACQAAVEAGAIEALLVRDNMVVEGSNTNLFAVKDGVTRTFPRVNILPGITRSVVLDGCREKDLPLIEEPVTVDELYDADEVFITGSVLEVFPVVAVDGRTIGNGKAGTVTRRIIDYYIERVRRECGSYPES